MGDSKLGFIHVRKGKSKNAKRNRSLSLRVRAMLDSRKASSESAYVFTDESGAKPVPIWTLEDQHKRMKASPQTACRCRDTLISAYVRHAVRRSWSGRLYDHEGHGALYCGGFAEVRSPDT